MVIPNNRLLLIPVQLYSYVDSSFREGETRTAFVVIEPSKVQC